MLGDNEEEFIGKKSSWCRSLVEDCEECLSDMVFREDKEDSGLTEEEIVRRLFTLGVALQYCPELISKRIILIVETLVASQHIQHEMTEGRIGVSDCVQTMAIVTLGKMCLLEEDFAKACVPSLVRELSIHKNSRIRNNIIMVLSDLCVRYTSLVDRHIGTLSTCLKDPAVIVRKQTLTLLTNLLKEDFLRWKGVLLYRFVSALLDPDESIRRFAEFCLIHVLLVRHPGMFSHHFLECLYFFNGVKHPSWESKECAEEDFIASSVGIFSLKGY